MIMKVLILLAVALAVFAADRQWRVGYVRIGQKRVEERASNAPVATGDQKLGPMLIDRALRGKGQEVRWHYIIDDGRQLFIVESKKPIEVEIDAEAKFATQSGDLFLMDQRNKEHKLKIVSQRSKPRPE